MENNQRPDYLQTITLAGKKVMLMGDLNPLKSDGRWDGLTRQT